MKRTQEQELEFRVKNPLCVFCKHSYYSFFKLRCFKKMDSVNCCARECPMYEATLERIEKRSPKV